jgi:hypothetical protein
VLLEPTGSNTLSQDSPFKKELEKAIQLSLAENESARRETPGKSHASMIDLTELEDTATCKDQSFPADPKKRKTEMAGSSGTGHVGSPSGTHDRNQKRKLAMEAAMKRTQHR